MSDIIVVNCRLVDPSDGIDLDKMMKDYVFKLSRAVGVPKKYFRAQVPATIWRFKITDTATVFFFMRLFGMQAGFLELLYPQARQFKKN